MTVVQTLVWKLGYKGSFSLISWGEKKSFILAKILGCKYQSHMACFLTASSSYDDDDDGDANDSSHGRISH